MAVKKHPKVELWSTWGFRIFMAILTSAIGFATTKIDDVIATLDHLVIQTAVIDQKITSHDATLKDIKDSQHAMWQEIGKKEDKRK